MITFTIWVQPFLRFYKLNTSILQTFFKRKSILILQKKIMIIILIKSIASGIERNFFIWGIRANTYLWLLFFQTFLFYLICLFPILSSLFPHSVSSLRFSSDLYYLFLSPSYFRPEESVWLLLDRNPFIYAGENPLSLDLLLEAIAKQAHIVYFWKKLLV